MQIDLRAGTPHIRICWDLGQCTLFRIRGDTVEENVLRYLYWGGDTALNTTYYSELGGIKHMKYEIVFTCSYWGGNTAQN